MSAMPRTLKLNGGAGDALEGCLGVLGGLLLSQGLVREVIVLIK